MTPTPTAFGVPPVFNQYFDSMEGSYFVFSNESIVVVETWSAAEETAKPAFSPTRDQIHLNSPQKQSNGLHRTTFIVPHFVQTTVEHPQVDRSLKTRYEGNINQDLPADNPNARAFGTSINNTLIQSTSSNTHSITQRRFASDFPVLQNDFRLSSHPSPVPMFSIPAPSSNQTMVHASPHNNRTTYMSYTMPVTPVNQLMHTTQPPDIQRQVRMKTSSSDHDHSAGWLWPVADSSLDAIHTPFGPPNSLSPQTPIDNSHVLDYPSVLAEAQQLSTAGLQLNDSSETNPLHPRLPRRLSYSQSLPPTSSPLVFNKISSAFPPQSTSQLSGNTIIDPFYNDSLASPLDIKTSALKTALHIHFDSTFSSTGSPSSLGAPLSFRISSPIDGSS